MADFKAIKGTYAYCHNCWRQWTNLPEDLQQGDLIDCPSCHEEMEVLSSVTDNQ